MANYTNLQKKDVLKICDNYSLILIDFQPIEGGATNSSFFLQTQQGDYVLTVFDKKTGAEVTKLAQLLCWFQHHAFPTTKPIRSNQSEIITYFEGKPVLLKVFIKGRVNPNLTTTMLLRVGMVMAKLHQMPSPTYLPRKHPCGYETFDTLIDRHINTSYESWLAKRLAYFEKHLPQELPTGLIHGDLFADNVLFEGNQIQAIIDFECACHYYKLFDLGMGILGMCVQENSVALDKARAFVGGYEQIRPLTPLEKEHLQLFVDYAATATSSWRYWKYFIDTPSLKKADKPWQMVRIADNIRAIPKSKFMTTIFD